MSDTAATIDRTSPLPLWAQVLEDLRTRIAADEFVERFPTDAELVADYGVSRQTVREAVRRLSAEGLLDRERGRGTFVRPALLQPVGTLPEIFGALRDRLGPVRSTTRRLAETTDADAAHRLGLDADAPLVVIDRIRTVQGAPIALDVAWLPAELARPLLEVDFTEAILADEVRDRCGLTPDDVAEEIVAVGATDEEAELLEPPPGGAVLSVSTVSTAGGRPYECRRVSFRGDRILLTSRWTRGEGHVPVLGASATD